MDFSIKKCWSYWKVLVCVPVVEWVAVGRTAVPEAVDNTAVAVATVQALSVAWNRRNKCVLATAVPAAVENTAVPALSVACCYHAHEMFLFKSMLWST